jgi:2-amino-4-hydroxy-6-hydroxymethyldihydropteridine diphosphokinase
MVITFIAFGSNLGERKKNISRALSLLSSKCTILKTSTIIETEPVGITNQPQFLNGVVKVETSLEPRELLEFLLSIEKKLGRERTLKNGPRIIDLDILLYGDVMVNEPGLTIPHPRMEERDFVMIPLKEVM